MQMMQQNQKRSECDLIGSERGQRNIRNAKNKKCSMFQDAPSSSTFEQQSFFEALLLGWRLTGQHRAIHLRAGPRDEDSSYSRRQSHSLHSGKVNVMFESMFETIWWNFGCILWFCPQQSIAFASWHLLRDIMPRSNRRSVLLTQHPLEAHSLSPALLEHFRRQSDSWHRCPREEQSRPFESKPHCGWL